MDDAQIEKLFEELASLKFLINHGSDYNENDPIFCINNKDLGLVVHKRCGNFFVVWPMVRLSGSEVKPEMLDENGDFWDIRADGEFIVSGETLLAFESGHIWEADQLHASTKYSLLCDVFGRDFEHE